MKTIVVAIKASYGLAFCAVLLSVVSLGGFALGLSPSLPEVVWPIVLWLGRLGIAGLLFAYQCDFAAARTSKAVRVLAMRLVSGRPWWPGSFAMSHLPCLRRFLHRRYRVVLLLIPQALMAVAAICFALAGMNRP